MATFDRYRENAWWWFTLYLILASRISGKKGIARQREFDELTESILGEELTPPQPLKKRRKAKVVESGSKG